MGIKHQIEMANSIVFIVSYLEHDHCGFASEASETTLSFGRNHPPTIP